MLAAMIMTADATPDAGIRYRVSVPTILRAICGPISPKKKKFPPNATEADDIPTAKKASNANETFTFTPNPVAMS